MTRIFGDIYAFYRKGAEEQWPYPIFTHNTAIKAINDQESTIATREDQTPTLAQDGHSAAALNKEILQLLTDDS